MISIWKSVILFTILMIIHIDARPQNAIDSNQTLDTVESDVDGIPNVYYDLPLQQQQQNVYPSMPLDRLQMLIAHYNRPTAYFRSPAVSGINELYRVPESKRQVRYRQCYFNPISCFKK
ncbi:allatostatin C isoform 1-T4 [Cochliomyia hominivorax]